MTVPPEPESNAPGGDPWAAFGYLVAGVLVYGLLGWLLSVWLNHDYWIPIGLLVGLGLGMYMVFARYRFREPTGGADKTMTPIDDPTAGTRPASSDRGDTE